MGFKTDYIEAIKGIEDLVQMMFEKMRKCCRYCQTTERKKPAADPWYDLYDTCLYHGRKGSHRCEREVCPLLEEEE